MAYYIPLRVPNFRPFRSISNGFRDMAFPEKNGSHDRIAPKFFGQLRISFPGLGGRYCRGGQNFCPFRSISHRLRDNVTFLFSHYISMLYICIYIYIYSIMSHIFDQSQSRKMSQKINRKKLFFSIWRLLVCGERKICSVLLYL